MSNANAPGTTGGARQESKSSGSGRSRSGVSLERPNESVVEYILAAVEANNGVAEIPAFAEDGINTQELVEQDLGEPWDGIVEALAEAAETVSFEDMFNVALSSKGYEYVGTPVILNEGDKGEYSNLDEGVKENYEPDDIYSYGDKDNGLKSYITAPDWVEIDRENRIHKGIVSDATTVVNGYFYPEIKEQLLGEQGGRVVVGIGRDNNHTDEDGNVDEFSKRRHVSFSLEEGESSMKRVVNAMARSGTIEESDKEAFQDGEADIDDLVGVVKQKRGF